MKTQERELTQEEQRRKVVFEKISEEMKAEGYGRQDLTVNIIAANIYMILFGWLSFTYVDGWNEGIDNLYLSFLFFPALLTLIVLHEVVHGLVWGLFAGFRSIRFGMIWKMLPPLLYLLIRIG